MDGYQTEREREENAVKEKRKKSKQIGKTNRNETMCNKMNQNQRVKKE